MSKIVNRNEPLAFSMHFTHVTIRSICIPTLALHHI
jgi:hypothetical protein